MGMTMVAENEDKTILRKVSPIGSDNWGSFRPTKKDEKRLRWLSINGYTEIVFHEGKEKWRTTKRGDNLVGFWMKNDA